MAIFEEKYGEKVRVLKIGEPAISMELCGGTHVMATGELGFFFVISESSVGAGLRRIEAVTGREAERIVKERFNNLEGISTTLGSSIQESSRKAQALVDELKIKSKQIESFERKQLGNVIVGLGEQKEVINGITVIAKMIPSSSIANLREIGDALREKQGDVVVVLGSVYEDKPGFIAMVSEGLVKKGVNAGQIVKQVAGIAGGGGGGRPDVAQAGGKDAGKVEEAIAAVKNIIEKINLK
jgi:alanyl-tRNA synthetase